MIARTRKLLLAATLLLATGAPTAQAESLPQAVKADVRIRTVPFQKDNIIQLAGMMGVSTMIVFNDDEKIATVAMGDSVAWQAVPDQSRQYLFINNTAVCMQRTRTFRQGTVAPTKNIHGSVTIQSDTGGIRSVSGQTVIGQALSGTTIGGNDFALLLGVANTVQAIKTKNVGQAVASLAAVAAAISANSTSLATQSGTIGQATTIKGAFEQNAIARLTNAQVWNQAIQAVSTANQLRNQRLLDLSAAASATAKAMTYDPSKVTLTNPEHQEGNR